MSKQPLKQYVEDEISMKKFIDFLMESWKVIVVCGFFGLLGSVGYVLVSSDQYMATAQIQLMRLSDRATTFQGLIVEDHNQLFIRLKSGGAQDTGMMSACDDGTKTTPKSIMGLVQLSSIKGAPSFIEIRIKMKSKERSLNCAQAIFSAIRDSQKNLTREYIEDSKKLLEDYQNRLKNIHKEINEKNLTETATLYKYLLYRDELIFLNSEIDWLSKLISSSYSMQTRLVGPINVFQYSTPHKSVKLLFGCLIGLFFGLLIAIIVRARSGRES